MIDRWFASRESQSVVGRVSEAPKCMVAESKAAGRQVEVMVPVMESKVAGSADVAVQELKPVHDPNEFEKICARFPGAWEDYLQRKGGDLAPKAVPQLNGTPIDTVAFIPRAKVEWLKLTGFSTVEQIAEISDAQMQDLGTGARTWRKKAREQLGR